MGRVAGPRRPRAAWWRGVCASEGLVALTLALAASKSCTLSLLKAAACCRSATVRERRKESETERKKASQKERNAPQQGAAQRYHVEGRRLVPLDLALTAAPGSSLPDLTTRQRTANPGRCSAISRPEIA
eukprot:3259177-Rhodomonas_salina.2